MLQIDQAEVLVVITKGQASGEKSLLIDRLSTAGKRRRPGQVGRMQS